MENVHYLCKSKPLLKNNQITPSWVDQLIQVTSPVDLRHQAQLDQRSYTIETYIQLDVETVWEKQVLNLEFYITKISTLYSSHLYIKQYKLENQLISMGQDKCTKTDTYKTEIYKTCYTKQLDISQFYSICNLSLVHVSVGFAEYAKTNINFQFEIII